MAKLKASTNKKARFQVYEKENRFAKNKKRDLERHLKLHPNDEVAKEAVKNIPAKPSRSTHVSSGVPEFKEITNKTLVKGKWIDVVERKIRVSRLDKQIAKLVKRALVFKDPILKAKDELFKQTSLANGLKTAHEHFDHVRKEKEERSKKQVKPAGKLK